MAGMWSLSNESPLFCYAIRKLNPEIFSHPVWVRFGRQGVEHALAIVEELFGNAERLEKGDASSACQILLASAVYQNIANECDAALETVHYALDLAKRTGFTPGESWAHWGACAICFQREDFDRAARHLEELEKVLTKENEWVLADFVDVVRQSLRQPEMVSTGKGENVSKRASNDPLDFAFQWLQNWGTSFQDPELDGRSKWGRWHAREFFHKWGIRSNGHTNGERQASVWQSIRGLLRLHEQGRKIESYPEVKDTQRPAETILTPVTEETTTEIASPKIKAATLIDNALSSNSKSILANDLVHINHLSASATTYIPVAVHMLGAFDLMIGEKSVKLPASRGLSLLKYLLRYHRQNTSREVLMDIFWPDAEPETARNNLNVAIHSLRTALRSVIFLPVIIFEDGAYGLAPDLQIWLDVEEFEKYVKSGQQLESQKQLPRAVTEYETAISLYQSDFLEENAYESWTILDRERLRVSYLDTLDRLSQIYFSQERYAACINLCELILTRDICREDVHCRLMQCYSRLGQATLALRQYQTCINALQSELEVTPDPATTHLYQKIRQHQRV